MKMFTQSKAAEQIGVNRATLRRWKIENKGPPTLRIGKRHYYTAEMVQQWQRALSRA
jgi:hypothetical protein